ncbi:MAG: acetyl-CoA carboxylase carboxyltransferase subunit alpha [candidate division Zixibacteria bacterium RBG_16_53_22]|nr:MAG: acetyl-CoA carboxylase carboxyltransferase subunit alpha [candidate division Zixibacteria bacterium RBG_16_53_22]
MDDKYYLEFEKPIVELDRKIREMKELAPGDVGWLRDEIAELEERRDKLQSDVYSGLTRWQRVQLARHPLRPYTLDYIPIIFTDFIELHGDRLFADDKALVGGFARLDGDPVMVVGQQKGRDVKQRQYRNFGMCHPEGYRKALRLFKLAEKYELPIIIFVDTPGAYPGIGAEERGQAEAIARNIREMSVLEVPILIAIIGEGASGGALGIGIGDTILMMENSWYSVISPEGCAAILWKEVEDPKQAEANRIQAADALKVTAEDLVNLNIIDGVIPEPLGGAHRDPARAAEYLKKSLLDHLKILMNKDKQTLLLERLRKYRAMGVFMET